jgi:protein involved in polysaccharide export with SLBB domain
MTNRAFLIALLSLPLTAGCGAGRGGSEKQDIAEQTAISAALQQAGAEKADYKIGPSDLLDISVYQDKDMNRVVRVSQNGTVSFPLIGVVKVGGLSVIEAQDMLSDKLKDFIVSPQITVFIKEYGNKKVFILGQVSKPGSYELPTEAKLTVLEAVSLAGGFTNIAAPDRTKIIRNKGGKSTSFTIEVSAITKRGEKSKDLPLEPNDVVYVPQSFF